MHLLSGAARLRRKWRRLQTHRSPSRGGSWFATLESEVAELRSDFSGKSDSSSQLFGRSPNDPGGTPSVSHGPHRVCDRHERRRLLLL